jgi:hypothetical protein
MKLTLRGKTGSLALAILLVGSVTSAPNIAQADTVIDEQFQVANPPGPGYTGYLVNNTRSLVRFWSNIATFKVDNQRIAAMVRCKTLAQCPANFTFQVADVNLKLCADATAVDCIAGVTSQDLTTKKNSSSIVARPELTADFGAEVSGNSAVGLPNGGNPLVISIPSAPHVGGDLYLVKTDFYAHRGESAANKFVLDLITNGIYPVTVEKGKFQPGGPNLDSNAYVGIPAAAIGKTPQPPYLSGFNADPRCLMSTEQTCIKAQAFPEKFSFGLNLRMSQGFNGWLYGRMANPDVSVTTAADKKSVTVQIQAEPVKVPLVFGWTKNSDLSAEMRAKYDKDRSGGTYAGNDPKGSLDNISILKGHSNKYDDLGIDEFLSWMPLLGDKAVAMPSQWSFQTLNLADTTAAELSKCTSSVSSLAGLIFTNASVFSSGAPSFDKAAGTLDYKVASPHTKADGSLTTGTYDLVLNSTVARCLYGFTKAPIGANVSVVSNDGQTQVATTVIKEANGFFRMGAYGFGFSSPTIKMKITQGGSASAVKTSITCIKGKTAKKVTGVSPTCPAGFKQK